MVSDFHAEAARRVMHQPDDTRSALALPTGRYGIGIFANSLKAVGYRL
jgi:hypothetical protein